MRLQGLEAIWAGKSGAHNLSKVSRGRDLELRAVRMVVSASSSSLDTQGPSGHQWTGTIIPWHGTYPGHREPGTLISWRGAPRAETLPWGGRG